MIRTLPAAQKPLVLRRFCSAYSKNRTKARAAKSEQKRGFMRGSDQSQSRQLPAVHFCQCSGLAFDPVSIEQKAGFSLFCYPVHISDQQPAHASAYNASQSGSLQASRQPPHIPRHHNQKYNHNLHKNNAFYLCNFSIKKCLHFWLLCGTI